MPTRRGFLKGLVAALVAAPVVAKTEWDKQEPKEKSSRILDSHAEERRVLAEMAMRPQLVMHKPGQDVFYMSPVTGTLPIQLVRKADDHGQPGGEGRGE